MGPTHTSGGATHTHLHDPVKLRRVMGGLVRDLLLHGADAAVEVLPLPLVLAVDGLWARSGAGADMEAGEGYG